MAAGLRLDALVLGHAKSPRRHIRVLGIGRADPAYGCDRRAWRSRLPQPSALAAPWTKIRPMWKRWDRCALSSLQYLGLPVPLDRLGAALRYQTDHDEAGRATSCGPRTSRLMVKVLAEESARLGVPVLNRCVGAKSVWDRHAARWISLESVGNVRAVPALHPFRRYRWHRSAISWAITIERHRNSHQHFPQGLSMAVPCLTNARLRFQPCRVDRATYRNGTCCEEVAPIRGS